MAISYSSHRVSMGDLDYPTKYDALVDDTEDIAQEVETARETESSLIANLEANYVPYTLEANIDGANTYKCTNMPMEPLIVRIIVL